MERENQKNPLQLWQIATANLKHNFLPLFLLSGIVIALTPLLFGTAALEETAAAAPLELMVSTIGIILLVPVFLPEQNSEIADVIASKYRNPVYVWLVRTACSVLGIVAWVLIFSACLFVRGCEITFVLVFGTIADAMFLGSMGLFVAAIVNNLPTALMVPLLYYILNLTLKEKLGKFNLFAMMDGDNEPNLWLFFAGVVLIVSAVVIRRERGIR